MRDLGRLRRSRHDRKIAGVGSGLARHFDLDPLLVRVALVVLVFFGGAGLIIYAACWLLVPEDDAIEAKVRLDDRSRTVALVLVGGIALLALLSDSLGGGWWAPWPLLVIGLVVYLVISSRGQRADVPPPGYGPAGPAPTSYAPAGYAPAGYSATGYAAPGWGPGAPAPTSGEPIPGPPPWPPAGPPTYAAAVARRRDPRRQGPLLFWFTMALSALGIGVLGLVDTAGLDVAAGAYPALVVGTIGVMLVVGAFYGRAGGLILAGLLATVATLVATAADEVDPAIDKTPLTAAQVQPSYDLWAGEIFLDLTRVEDLEALDGRTISLDATFGEIRVLVPDGLDTVARATVNTAGSTVLFGEQTDGSATATVGDGDGPEITIQAEVTLGEIRIDQRSAR